MRFERIFFWIQLVAEVILDILERLEEPGEGAESFGDPDQGFKPERIQVWLGILARGLLNAVDGFGVPDHGTESAEAIGPEFKPERIQFWLRLITRFLMAIFTEETGKSGEESSSEEVDW